MNNQNNNSRSHENDIQAIAVIGVGCRFPNAHNPEEFWQVLRNGVDTISEIPKDRWDIDAFYDPNPLAPGKMCSRWGGFIEDVAMFDARFFGITNREAQTMDPQQRLLMEVSWEALENAGKAPDRLVNTQTGVFIGISTSDYWQLQTRIVKQNRLNPFMATGVTHSVAAGRLSYFFGFQGPSLALDTACSSSLVAVHLACQSLRHGECNLALAGGVNIILTPDANIIFSKSYMLSPDGRCKTFDASANGYVRGEGCGIIILKRLSDALVDNDNILAIVRSSAVNQDGRSNGLTAPNLSAQEEVINKALVNGNIKPSEVNYIEAHGTGTPLGDPIEIQALNKVLGQDRTQDQPLIIGSVKTNVGHLEAAAGIVSLIKVILSLYNNEIPPHLHFKTINPHIILKDIPAMIPTTLTSWPSAQEKCIAGVSSFGFSGTNAHIILEGRPAAKIEKNEITRPLHIYTLSGKNENALHDLLERQKKYLEGDKQKILDAICYTINKGRSHFNYRSAVIVNSIDQLLKKITVLIDGKEEPGIMRGIAQEEYSTDVVFLCTGEGSHYFGMGQQLYTTEPVFRTALDQCSKILQNYLEVSLLSVLYEQSPSNALLERAEYYQSAMFALEYALIQLWKSWGIEPSVIMGYHIGEYVAACIAGVFSLEDGLQLTIKRAQIFDTMDKNRKSIQVCINEKQIADIISSYTSDQVSIAAINGPESIVITGRIESVEDLVNKLIHDGIKTEEINTPYFFHPLVKKSVLDEFITTAKTINYNKPKIRLISHVTGKLVNDDEVCKSDYWISHIKEPIKFYNNIQILHELSYKMFIEVGPDSILSELGNMCIPDNTCIWVPSLKKDKGDFEQIFETMGCLYVNGMNIDWEGFYKDYTYYPVQLPTYPFQRDRYWLE